jgi:general secretion pathway protein I
VAASRSAQRGFTLLEAIVAMVLISTLGGALLSWLNTEIVSLGRMQDSSARAEATANAVEFMENVNPMLRPEGKVSFAAFGLAWQARATTPIQDGTSYPQGIGLYQLAMYDTTVQLAHGDGSEWFKFTLAQVGYKRVRDNKPF